MGQPEEFDGLQKKEEEANQVSDTYTSETTLDLYNTPDVNGETSSDLSGEPSSVTGGEGEIPSEQKERDPYAGNSCYGNPQENRQAQGNDPYTGASYYGAPSGNRQAQGNDPYTGNPYYGAPSGNRQAQGNGPYTGNPYYGAPYGNQQAQGDHSYAGNTCHGNSYGNQQTYGNAPYNNQYSPYASPARKQNTRLVIGIVAGIIILFLIAVFALTYKVVTLYSEEREKSRHGFEEYEFHDDREKNREKRREENDADFFDDYDYDDYYDDSYDDYYDDYYNDYYDDDYYDYDSDQYYTLHDDIRSDLSYSVDFDYYEYDTNDEDVSILVTYPVIIGENVPNLEHINGVIEEEINLFKDYFEEEYEGYMDNDDSYFSALSSGYVTYMDEEKLSIVFSEYLYTDYYDEAFLYCINIDMENGVILDNENMLSIDDDFSVEFRKRSDVQNGEIVYLTGMTDQEITDYFNSSNIIVFYTPKGMEIGFNYEEGWVTVTYEEYQEYLKVF